MARTIASKKYAPPSNLFDWFFVSVSAVWVTGVFVDGWAHIHILSNGVVKADGGLTIECAQPGMGRVSNDAVGVALPQGLQIKFSRNPPFGPHKRHIPTDGRIPCAMETRIAC